MFKVKSHFIGHFKVGDNIGHNLEVLRLLYRYFNRANETNKFLLCKPIVITLVSISEAAIYDLHHRAKHFNKEGINGVSKKVLEYIRKSDLKDYQKQIASIKRHRLLGHDNGFYEKVDELRKLRNRIHIQNKNGDFERDEINAFNVGRKKQAEKTTEYILCYLSKHYPRPSGCYHVKDFALPWKRHFSNKFYFQAPNLGSITSSAKRK